MLYNIMDDREWRQKIESWLRANSQEERREAELRERARRLQANRRSLENDSGHYNTLTLFIFLPSLQTIQKLLQLKIQLFQYKPKYTKLRTGASLQHVKTICLVISLQRFSDCFGTC